MAEGKSYHLIPKGILHKEIESFTRRWNPSQGGGNPSEGGRNPSKGDGNPSQGGGKLLQEGGKPSQGGGKLFKVKE